MRLAARGGLCFPIEHALMAHAEMPLTGSVKLKYHHSAYQKMPGESVGICSETRRPLGVGGPVRGAGGGPA